MIENIKDNEKSERGNAQVLLSSLVMTRCALTLNQLYVYYLNLYNLFMLWHDYIDENYRKIINELFSKSKKYYLINHKHKRNLRAFDISKKTLDKVDKILATLSKEADFYQVKGTKQERIKNILEED